MGRPNQRAEGGQAGAPAAVALAQSPTDGGQDFVGGGNDAAPWDMLLQQAASGDVGGEGLETMGANLPGVPGASPAAAGSGAAPGNAKAGNGNGGISQASTTNFTTFSEKYSFATILFIDFYIISLSYKIINDTQKFP